MSLLGLLFLVACQSKTREAQEEDEWIEVEEEKTVECPECDGSRYLKQTCSACGGYASTTSYTTGQPQRPVLRVPEADIYVAISVMGMVRGLVLIAIWVLIVVFLVKAVVCY